MKTAKKIFKIVGIILGIIILALIGYIIYLFASYHRIEDNLPLEVESHAADAELTTEKEYSALTYNIGFGAYTPDFSFFIPQLPHFAFLCSFWSFNSAKKIQR